MKKKLIIILVVLIVLYLIGKGCSSTSPTSAPTPTTTTDNTAQETPKEENDVKLPENKFDTTTNIPGTDLVLAYPSQGFYQLGAVLKKNEPGDPESYGNVLTIQAKETYNAEKGSQFVTAVVALRDAGSLEKTLKDVENIVKPNAVEADFVKENGNYQTIAGREFFIYKVDQFITMWRAVTLQNNQVMIVTLMYKATDSKESEAAYKNNDTLFLEIIKNISSK